jgi:hypothetical protein
LLEELVEIFLEQGTLDVKVAVEKRQLLVGKTYEAFHFGPRTVRLEKHDPLQPS